MRWLMPVIVVGVLAGCSGPSHDPTPPAQARPVEIGARPMSLEATYRRLYERLEACVGGGYHVQPRYDRVAGTASIMLVQGLGLNRYSVLGNVFRARVELTAVAGQATRIEMVIAEAELDYLERAIPAWLAGAQECVR